MKKIILTVAAVFALTFANAQDIKSSKGENYLPEAGDWAIGFNADGLFKYAGNMFSQAGNNDAPSVNFQNESYFQNGNAATFVGKKFITDKMAYRVMANFYVNSGSSGDAAASAGEKKETNFGLKAGLGKEWRRGKTRLQGFYGADLYLSFTSNKTTNTKTVSLVNTANFERTESSNRFGLGARGCLGAEYFLFPKISIGAQYTYGLDINVTGATKVTQTGSPDSESGKSTNINLGKVGVTSVNMTLHF
jgi:hypothetical protein